MAAVKYSLVIPVYRNEESIDDLLAAVGRIDRALGHRLEAVFVVDGSPDRSYARLEQALPASGLNARLLELSRNFGSFAALRAGIVAASGTYVATMAADLQEPEQLILDFFHALEHEPVDVAFGVRSGRSDPLGSRIASGLFWGAYRRLVQRDIPPGGIDVFACNRAFRDHLLAMHESNTSLVGQVMWLGFRRKLVPYRRLPRRHGRSAWSFSRKLRYLSDSLFAFSDLPIRALIWAGVIGLAVSVSLGLVVLVARLSGAIDVPGYAATVLTIMFFAALNSFGLGVVGSYTWRAYENTKGRPSAVVMSAKVFGDAGRAGVAVAHESRADAGAPASMHEVRTSS